MKRIISLITSIVFVFSAFSTLGFISSNAEGEGGATPVVEYQVLERIEKLTELLDGRYFTTSGNSCHNSCCDKCMNLNVIKAGWFKVMFGNINADQLPGHTYPDGSKGYPTGWSCHGFANFAMWYIFSNTENDYVESKTVAYNLSLTRPNILKHARPGDIIRYYNGGSGHSVIFVSAEEDGITVLDCNSRINGDSYCCVRLHKIKYTGNKMAISRATNYVDIPTLNVNFNAGGATITDAEKSERFLIKEDGTIEYRDTQSVFTQKFLYDKELISVVDDGFFGLVNGENEFIGWSTSPDGEVVVGVNAVLLAQNILENPYFENKTVTLYAKWRSNHVHKFSDWIFNGNESFHSRVCRCGLAEIEEHKWVIEESSDTTKTCYHCEGCEMKKTVYRDNGVYSVGGVFYHFENPDKCNGWFLVNGNKILSFDSHWGNEI